MEWLAYEPISVNKEVLLCHIGLVMDHDSHQDNQPCLPLFEKCWKTTVWRLNKHSYENKQTNKHEHSEENVQMKAHAYVHRWLDQNWFKEFSVVIGIR